MSSPSTVITTCISIPIAATGRMQTWNANVMLEDRIPTAPQQLLNTLSLQLPTNLSLDDMVNVDGGVTPHHNSDKW